jgi:hypothetical protein
MRVTTTRVRRTRMRRATRAKQAPAKELLENAAWRSERSPTLLQH